MKLAKRGGRKGIRTANQPARPVLKVIPSGRGLSTTIKRQFAWGKGDFSCYDEWACCSGRNRGSREKLAECRKWAGEADGGRAT